MSGFVLTRPKFKDEVLYRLSMAWWSIRCAGRFLIEAVIYLVYGDTSTAKPEPMAADEVVDYVHAHDTAVAIPADAPDWSKLESPASIHTLELKVDTTAVHAELNKLVKSVEKAKKKIKAKKTVKKAVKKVVKKKAKK